MNIRKNYNDRDERILTAALKAVARTAGLQGKIVQMETDADAAGYRADAIVDLNFEHRKYHYTVEVKTIDRAMRIDLVKNLFREHTGTWLLAAPHITAEMAEYCRAQGVQFIDTTGNAYLKAEGLYIFITGNKRDIAELPVNNDRATTATGMRVVFALLCKPQLLNAPYREIAAAAGVALGTVGWVFYALQNRGQLLIDERKNRQFTDIRRVIEEWTQNYPVRLKPRLAPRRFRAPAANWWENFQPAKYEAFFGGEVAGYLLTKYRNPGETIIYANGDPAPIIIENRLKADPAGDVEIVEKFWDFDLETNEPGLVPPLLAYADLMAARDPRDRDVARIIYERFMTNA